MDPAIPSSGFSKNLADVNRQLVPRVTRGETAAVLWLAEEQTLDVHHPQASSSIGLRRRQKPSI
jgi:hypothetical protein